MSRYDKLLELINLAKPQSIVEIGTWNGQNAIRMLHAAHKHTERPYYIGYDLFEEATDETDAAEYNVKAHFPMATVEAEIKKACPFAEVALVRGNTRETLHPVTADFAFIDGGHSIETIAKDYENLKHSALIVFDDYYLPDDNGKMPDITKVGCNEIVNRLPHMIIEDGDIVREYSNGPKAGKNAIAVVFGVND